MLIPSVELQALWDLFSSTGGAKWIYNGFGQYPWQFNISQVRQIEQYNLDVVTVEYPYNPCEWEGITCQCSNSSYVQISNDQLYHPFENSQTFPYYFYYYDDDTGNSQFNFSSSNNVSIFCGIQKIYLIDHNLQGTLPSNIGSSFINLTHLHLSRNSIESSIPSVWTSLRLEQIDLCSNRLCK